MQDYEDAVNAIYSSGGLASRILQALERAGVDVDNLSVDALTPLEELHIAGRKHTLHMAQLVGLVAGMQVIDIGCGIGGPARALAHHFGCKVSGIDLTKEFCSVGRMLTERTGLGEMVEIRHADAVDLPFDDAVFDVAWLQHTITNVPDKARLFSEIARVLRSRGKVALYEVVSGTEPVAHFPVPWTRDASVSFLVEEAELLDYLNSAGFICERWDDLTGKSIDFLERVLAKPGKRGSPGLSPGVILGPEYRLMMTNVLKNMEENRMRVVQGVFILA
ncbi:MAG: methyltransferase domain-containing protein [Candidatus Eisenbacteria bacterium]